MQQKKCYSTPQVLQEAHIALEGDLLFGSIVDWIYPVETAGSDVDQVYDYFSDDTFNHQWRD